MRASLYLWLDGILGHAVFFQPEGIDFAIKMANVTDNGVLAHLQEMFSSDNALASGGGDYQVGEFGAVVHCVDLESFHGGLESVDWINFGNDDPAAERFQRLGGSLTDVTVSGADCGLSSQHNVSCTLDAINK